MQCKFIRQFGFCPSSEFCEFAGGHPAPCSDKNGCADYTCAAFHTEPLCSSWSTCNIHACPRRHGQSRPASLLSRGAHAGLRPVSMSQGLYGGYHSPQPMHCLGELEGEEDGSMTDAESDTVVGGGLVGDKSYDDMEDRKPHGGGGRKSNKRQREIGDAERGNSVASTTSESKFGLSCDGSEGNSISKCPRSARDWTGELLVRAQWEQGGSIGEQDKMSPSD